MQTTVFSQSNLGIENSIQPVFVAREKEEDYGEIIPLR